MRTERITSTNGDGRGPHDRALEKPPRTPLALRGHSLRDTLRVGVRLWMRTPTKIVGLGSAASRTVCQTTDHVMNELGFLPNVLAYLCLDADADFRPRHRDHCFPFGVDGAGTDATKGRALFLAKAAEIWEVLKSHFFPLLAGDPRFPTELTARQATTVHVVAGSGGTSGGAEQPFISLLHHLAQVFAVQELRVHVHRIAPDVPLADTSRTTSREQHEIVHSTFAANVWQSLSDFALDELREEKRHDGRKLSVPCRLRVTSHSLTSRTNGQVDCLTSADTEAKLAWALLQRSMTASGMEHEARTCDEHGFDAPYGLAR